MKFNFELLPEDFIHFNYYYGWYRPEKKKLRVIIYLYPFLAVLAVLAVQNSGQVFSIPNLITLGLTVAISPFIGRLYRKLIKSKSLKYLRQNPAAHITGEKAIALTENNLILSADEEIVSTIKWESMHSFREDQLFYYLFITSQQAVIVPKRIFQEEEQEFRKFAKRKIAATK
ncbi:YcxB family protein [Persicobacter sp. CCB-QB2]|uniref:YcxB family protein n=1 Tax=Persicobacter sp. CCB-QB2 TaxID=1561025 RepID=UPI0006A9B8A8|nr:YcxB family protein [Persicobacter sp. CCB-QB2]